MRTRTVGGGGREEGEGVGVERGGDVHITFSPRWRGIILILPDSRWAAAGEGVEEEG